MANFNSWNSSREWMYNRIDPHTNNISEEFVAGVNQFMNMANSQPIAQSSGGKFYCPCIKCQNEKLLPGKRIWNHLYSKGFMPNYYVWYEHGEEYDMVGNIGTSHANTNYASGSQPEEFEEGNIYTDMVNDAFRGSTVFNDSHAHENGHHVHEEPTHKEKQFYDMLEAANTPLYDGCREGHSQLSLAARFMNIKADNNMTESCMDSWAELFTEYLPEGNQATGSYYETESLMRKLGLPYYTYDVCVDNCMLFWKEDENLDHCKFCAKPRYKSSEGRTRIPFSRMWYLPVADRLKRMYQSDRTASLMRWHAEHDSNDGEMCHPSDAAEWKNFNQLHPTFAKETRNVYLGLCTDGFNPFGMSRNHSLWPVIMTPYNLPPHMCMKREYLFLTILNSGPNHPRASLDVFLQPLIHELKELWYNGVEAYDVSSDQKFNLKAVLLWTISDFPAYGMLSGWTTHGRLSCPICMDDTNAFQLPAGRKTCWFDCHRRFLPRDHPLRSNTNNFLKRKHALDDYPPESLTSEQVLKRIRHVGPQKTSECGGNGHEKKKKGYGKWHNWHKESIFWELPYWKDLTLRHNLDVMHIEKNFFDNIINTIMNVKDKTKDNVKSRLDIAKFCSRKDLHVDSQGRAPFPIFRLTAKAKQSLLEWVKNEVKFPDGYASDLASCADISGGKFSGMKSHDCHVFMERLLPFIFAELLPRNVHLALSGIGAFFRDLSSRSLDQNRIQILKDNIVMILCNLEKIFPPSFFDVMEHLAIHLPYEAELGGPVQYRWMYVFERFFKFLKGKAKNKRFAAGSIIQSYINDEISYFSEHYFASHISTRIRRPKRFDEGQAPIYHVLVPDIFTHAGRPSGKSSEIWLTEKDYQCAHAYVLRNCDYFQPFERLMEDQIRFENQDLSDDEVALKRDENFHIWIRQYVINTTKLEGPSYFPPWVHDLVEGPINKVKSWPMYFTRGYLFHTRAHGLTKKTMNYGICVRGQNYSATSEDDFYGTVTNIIELEYPGLLNLKITLFYCEWFDPTIGVGTRKSDGGIVDVLSSRRYNNYEPFILGSQADQVSYLPYPYIKRPRKLWLAVLKVNPRSTIEGKYNDNEPVILQQITDDEIVGTIEEIAVGNLADGTHPFEEIDFEIEDTEAQDEFHCNLSTSDDEDEEFE